MMSIEKVFNCAGLNPESTACSIFRYTSFMPAQNKILAKTIPIRQQTSKGEGEMYSNIPK